MAGDYLAESLSISLKKKQFAARSGTGRFSGHDVLLLLPQTYMNNSGRSVTEAASYYRVSPDGIIAVHDEVELPFGEYRYKFGGGHKGNNGIRSMIQHLDTADFHRVRIGVGRPDNPHMTMADYLLSDFSKEELSHINTIFPGIEDMITDIINGSLNGVSA